MTYEVGDQAVLTVTFTDVNGNPAGPTTVVLIVDSPNGTSTAYNSPASISIGVYQQIVPVTMSGIYSYRWTGTGALTAVIEGSITVAQTLLTGTRPSALDLCTLDQVKDWLAMNGVPANTLASLNGSDIVLQRLITAAGLWWLRQTGRLPSDGSIPLISPLVQICPFNEWYDGSSGTRQYVRNPPVTSITLVTINNVTIPISTGPTVWGVVIAEYGSSIALRVGGYSQSQFPYGQQATYRGIGRQGGFCEGIQNVNLQYNGGYAGTPYDVGQACVEMIGFTFRKRGWIGLRSQMLAAGGGTVGYQNWVVEPSVKRVIEHYTRKAIV